MWQNAAFVLIGVGILIIIGYFAKGFFMASEIPLAFRIAAGVVAVGVLILIGVAIKERVAKAKTERFKEVEK